MSPNPLSNAETDLLRIQKVGSYALEVSLQNSQGEDLAEAHQAGFVTYVRALTILLQCYHFGKD